MLVAEESAAAAAVEAAAEEAAGVAVAELAGTSCWETWLVAVLEVDSVRQ